MAIDPVAGAWFRRRSQSLASATSASSWCWIGPGIGTRPASMARIVSALALGVMPSGHVGVAVRRLRHAGHASAGARRRDNPRVSAFAVVGVGPALGACSSIARPPPMTRKSSILDIFGMGDRYDAHAVRGTGRSACHGYVWTLRTPSKRRVASCPVRGRVTASRDQAGRRSGGRQQLACSVESTCVT